uniref:PHAGOCYTE NADPH OXIDASE SUBUNIT P67PHOX/PHAGOCYTE, P47PHOX, SH3-PEPTIDE COMPLEX, HELIX-TURN-HELIX n=1 Tax=Siphoviridae sp. ctvyM23 TaxID=2826514 RepID=A0A8S5MI10_9CAUD|nr:MAG TPA: PHAGOCYTE NADPH OXIDASE SUBUNIT P67PHOX/PHAGOCYTE, P47PHOX, SH3-PEPTIDE COMPLEX, HELIX-TURN-HELIX [Siphoviridae sp. ctvyM23]
MGVSGFSSKAVASPLPPPPRPSPELISNRYYFKAVKVTITSYKLIA